MKIKIITTKDNSPSLYVPELDEHYHSINGAVSESLHVFIKAGLKYINKRDIQILEVGFGTGLNTLLTILENKYLKKNIYYEAIEKFPLKLSIIEQLHYFEDEDDLFIKLHTAEWKQTVHINENFKFKKLNTDLSEFSSESKFDLIYFDAFAPDKQAELWTEKVFHNLYQLTNKDGILVTYSSKGTVKQALRNVGYTVQRLKGPEGKRHMIRA